MGRFRLVSRTPFASRSTIHLQRRLAGAQVDAYDFAFRVGISKVDGPDTGTCPDVDCTLRIVERRKVKAVAVCQLKDVMLEI